MALKIVLVTVAAAGTRVQFNAGVSLNCKWFNVQADSANTGKTYPGDSTVSSTVYGVSLLPSDSFTFPPMANSAPYDLKDFWADSDTSGNKLRVIVFT
jgi:hypothetical protein